MQNRIELNPKDNFQRFCFREGDEIDMENIVDDYYNKNCIE